MAILTHLSFLPIALTTMTVVLLGGGQPKLSWEIADFSTPTGLQAQANASIWTLIPTKGTCRPSPSLSPLSLLSSSPANLKLEWGQ